jgi:uncharacterized protein
VRGTTTDHVGGHETTGGDRAAGAVRARRGAAVALVLALAVASVAAGRPATGAPDDGFDSLRRNTEPAPWTVRPGVEQITVFGAEPGQAVTLYGPGQRKRLTLLADELGQAHFSYLPARHAVAQSGPDLDLSDLGDMRNGGVVEPGRYLVRDDSASPKLASEPIAVIGRDDVPEEALYEGQQLHGVELDLLGNPKPGGMLEDGFQYLEMRDGVLLSAMVRFPDSATYGPAPYPTVIEYSGYAPSNPANEEAGARLARALGYATVSVNLRGTGCSGGVFDVFNPAQAADGYDVVEIVARQPWVLHGEPGMVGLSYSGITQLYTAATNPPHLAAVTPQSVIADPWLQAWPGGIFNDGFTRQWIQQRNAQAAPGGTSWVQRRIDAGDEACAAHQALRNQNPDFETFVRGLETYNPSAVARDLRRLVPDIEAPTFITGAFQDEQTGPQFTAMLDDFHSTEILRVGLWNGRHPDGYGPANIVRWFEFLELYVAKRVPEMHPFVRLVAPALLAEQFGLEDVTLEPDRFASFGDDHAGARAAYEAEAPVRVIYESGIGENEIGEPGGTFELALDEWPAPDAGSEVLFLGSDGLLTRESPGPPTPGTGGPRRMADAFRFDPEAGGSTLFGGTGQYPLLAPVWDVDWTRFGPGRELSYLTEPLEHDVVTAGPGYAELWVAAEAADTHLQVSVSEVRPDGVEYLVQTGWLDVGHRAEDPERTDGNEVVHLFTADAYEPVRGARFVPVRVPIPSFGHPFRQGSQIRLSIATPGRNHATWEFENPDYGGAEPTIRVGRSDRMPSALVLSVLDGVAVPEVEPAPCPALRGQACRLFEPTENLPG